MRNIPFQAYAGSVPSPIAAYAPPIRGLAMWLAAGLAGSEAETFGVDHFATAAAAPAMPARFYMRPYRIPLGSQTFAYGGQSLTFDLRRQGYTVGLLVRISGTYTVATAPLVFHAFAPYNSVAKFLVTQPRSPLPPINLSGWPMHLWNLLGEDFAPHVRGFRFPAQGSLDANAYHAGRVDQFPVAIGAQTGSLEWYIPFTLSADDIRGIVPTGNMSQVTLKITPAAIADLVTVAANLTLPAFTVEVTQFCLTPPSQSDNIIGGGVDLSQAVAYDEESLNIATAGLQRVAIDPTYTILGILHGVAINDALDSNDVAMLNLMLNSSFAFEPPGINMGVMDSILTGQYDVPLPQGVALYDQDLLGMADWISTRDLTEIESQINVSLATAPATILTSVRRLVPLV